MTSRVWQTSKQTGGNLLLLMAMADFADDEGVCFPAVGTIAKKARMTPRHAQRVIKILEECGELTKQENAGPHGVNVYRILTPDISSPPASASSTPRLVGHPPHDAGVIQTVIEPSKDTNPPDPAGEKFVDWFLDLLKRTKAPEVRLTVTNRAAWADAFDKLQRIDGKSKAQIWKACEWARNDPFWSGNFYAPTKLRERKDGVARIDLFLDRMANPHENDRKPNGRGFEQCGDYSAIKTTSPMSDWKPTLNEWHPDVALAARECARFVAQVAAGAEPYWLTLTGEPGCGKTHLARQTYSRVKLGWQDATKDHPQQHGTWDERKRRPGCRWTDETDFARLLLDDRQWDLPEHLAHEWLVGYDDLGTKCDTKAREVLGDALCRLANQRLGKWTIWTTNWSLEEIKRRVDPRVSSRLIRDRNRLVTITAGDYAARRR